MPVSFEYKTVVPPRRDIGPRVGARTDTRRGEAQRSTRSEAESCADGLSWHNDPAEGELYIKKNAREERKKGGKGAPQPYLVSCKIVRLNPKISRKRWVSSQEGFSASG